MFQNPLLLIGVGAAVVPLVLHLLSRARYRDVDWGAMMFLPGADAPEGGAAVAGGAAPTTDLRAVADRIAAATLGYGRANMAAALREAADRLRGYPGPRDVYVITDRQASNWNEVNDAFVAAWH